MTFNLPVNTSITFTPTIISTLVGDTGPYTYEWDFGGVYGGSALEIPTNTYNEVGQVNVSLIVTNTTTGAQATAYEVGFIAGGIIQGTVSNTRLLFNSQGGGTVWYIPASGDVNRVDKIFDNGNAVNMYPTGGIGTAHAFGLMTDPSVQIDMLIPTKIDGYSMIYADISYHGIWKWELFGSDSIPLDNGSNMTLVDQKDIGYLSVNPYTASITPVTYRYYRLVSHATNNGNAVNRMLEFRLLRNNL